MNRREFLALAASKIPPDLPPLTEAHLRVFIERGLIEEPLRKHDVPKVIQLLGMLETFKPRQATPTAVASLPEIDHVVHCASAEDVETAAAKAFTTPHGLPPGTLYVNFTDKDYSLQLEKERRMSDNLPAYLRSIPSNPDVSMFEKSAYLGMMKLSLEVSKEAGHRTDEPGLRLDIPGFPPNSILNSWYVTPDGGLVPDFLQGKLQVNCRYLHRVMARIPDGYAPGSIPA
jgi:hypothetical protein